MTSPTATSTARSTTWQRAGWPWWHPFAVRHNLVIGYLGSEDPGPATHSSSTRNVLTDDHPDPVAGSQIRGVCENGTDRVSGR